MENLAFFKDLKVVELATVLAGPAVGMFFSEVGAKVTKVENPKVPDVTRSWKLSQEDKTSPISAYFCAINWNKEYVTLDLKNDSDQIQLHQLLSETDILITNFKKRDDIKFNLTYSDLKKKYPTLICAHLTGYGSDSPRAAYDVVLQAETGFMSMNGQPDGPPTKMPVALIDVLAAHQLKEGILCALLERTKTGQGALVEVNLFESAIASLANQASNYLMNEHIPQRLGSLHPNIAPYGEIFQTKNGDEVVLAIGSNKQFQLLLNLLSLTSYIEDERFLNNQNRVVNRTELARILADEIVKCETDWLLNASEKQNIPIGLIRNLKQVFDLAQAQGLVLNEDIDGVNTRRVQSTVFKITT